MSFLVRFVPAERCVRVAPRTLLLDAVREAGLPIASGCGASALCGRCALLIVSGEGSLSPETRAESAAKQRNGIDADLRLACCAEVRGDVEATARYW